MAASQEGVPTFAEDVDCKETCKARKNDNFTGMHDSGDNRLACQTNDKPESNVEEEQAVCKSVSDSSKKSSSDSSFVTEHTGETRHLVDNTVESEKTHASEKSQLTEDMCTNVSADLVDHKEKDSENDDAIENCGKLENDSGESEEEYESAEEGEEIQVDTLNLTEMEDNLTDEEKEERRKEASEVKNSGNEMFRNGSYKSAIQTYSRALRMCPLKFAKDRAILYSNRAACKMKLEENEACIKDCTKALDLHPHYLKALMRRAELYEKTEKLDEALADYQKIVEMDPSQHSARAACMRLPDQIKERNEKLKEEMMGKLKDLGNLVLRPFGLSTNNFKLNQDPNTGGYSVNFVQNPDQNQ